LSDRSRLLLHASSVALEGRALLILGPSGSGKSSVALQLMALGCTLVSDDQTEAVARDGRLWASAPARIKGRIEARGIGLLGAETVDTALVVLAVDMSRTEEHRLPPERTIEIAGISVPCLHKVEGGHFVAGLLQYLKSVRTA
jgi:HPr kinase/phosphorylase